MSMREGKFKGADGIDLYYQAWTPDGPSRANLIIVHGFGEHTGRWQNVLAYFPPRGYSMYIYDQRGHGRSPGQRGYIDEWAQFRTDLGCFVDLVSQQAPDQPCFLYGMSMGGLVILDYCLHHPEGLAGAIVSAPAIGEIGLPPAMFLLARLLDKVWPRFSMENPISADLISRDPAWVKFLLSDPLSHGKGTPRLLIQIQKTKAWVKAHAAEWRLPLLVLHGTADAFASIEGSRQFVSSVNRQEARLIEYQGGYHELHNDIIKDQVFEDLSRWLEDCDIGATAV